MNYMPPPEQLDGDTSMWVKLPVKLLREIENVAKKTKLSRSEVVRAALRQYLGCPETVERRIAAEKPQLVVCAPAGSCLAYFERGFTINQIAAIMKLPYKQVAEEIGLAVDVIAAKALDE